MNARKKIINPTYTKRNGLTIFDIDSIDTQFDIKERSIISVPPKGVGGNHKHPRWEAFIGFGKDLKIAWIDASGQLCEELMNPSKKYFLFTIFPFTAHRIINTSEEELAVLFEFASEKQHDVKKLDIFDSSVSSF